MQPENHVRSSTLSEIIREPTSRNLILRRATYSGLFGASVAYGTTWAVAPAFVGLSLLIDIMSKGVNTIETTCQCHSLANRNFVRGGIVGFALGAISALWSCYKSSQQTPRLST